MRVFGFNVIIGIWLSLNLPCNLFSIYFSSFFLFPTFPTFSQNNKVFGVLFFIISLYLFCWLISSTSLFYFLVGALEFIVYSLTYYSPPSNNNHHFMSNVRRDASILPFSPPIFCANVIIHFASTHCYYFALNSQLFKRL